MVAEESKGMLVRGLSILEYVAKAQPGTATVVAISEGTGLPKSTVYRLASTEREMGYLSYDETTKSHSLGPKLFELAASHSASRSLSQIAQPAMEGLSRKTGETIQLSILSGSTALFVGRVSSPHAITIRGNIGQAAPLYATSTGKVLLANLPEASREKLIGSIEFTAWTENTLTSKKDLEEELSSVLEQGFATANEEFDAGVVALGVPIADAAGSVAAAICISAPKYRTSMRALKKYLPDLKEAAQRIGLMLVGQN